MAYQRKDTYYRRAKAAGYRSRAAYKLLQLAGPQQLIHRGDRVVDLGSWPGGWLQIAAEAVGPDGRVVGVDIAPLSPLPQPWAHLVFGDVANENVQTQIRCALGGPADVVLSDMAPKLTGVRDRDEARAHELAETAVTVARKLLRPGGRLLLKAFTSESTRELLSEIKRSFENVRTTKPEATRKGSAEVYIVATRFMGKSPEADTRPVSS